MALESNFLIIFVLLCYEDIESVGVLHHSGHTNRIKLMGSWCCLL